MVAINIKQRKELIEELQYLASSGFTFTALKDGATDLQNSAWRKLVKLLQAEEDFSLVGKECEKKDVKE